MFRSRKIVPLIVAAVAVLGMASQADAAFKVRITTTAGSTTITDGGAGDLDLLLNKSITVSYSDTAYNLVGVIAFTNSPGNGTFAILDASFNINTLNGGTGGAASIEATSTDFSQPGGNPLTLTSSINGNGSGTGSITLQQFVDTNNNEFGEAGAGVLSPGVQGPFSIAAGYGSVGSINFTRVGLYSLTDELKFNLATDSNTSGDSQSRVTPTPAPAGLLLIFSAGPVLGVGAWLRRRRNAA